MRLTLVLPLAYSILSVVLVAAFGNIGHGRGIEIFYYLSLPAGFLSNLVEVMFRSGELALLSCFLAGLLQYTLVGYAFEIYRERRRKGGI